MQFKDIQVIQFIDQQKVAKKVAAGWNFFSIQDSAKYPVLCKHCPHISKCPKRDS